MKRYQKKKSWEDSYLPKDLILMRKMKNKIARPQKHQVFLIICQSGVFTRYGGKPLFPKH